MMALAIVLLVHSWYPLACCKDKDCHPVPCESISKIGNDYVLRTDYHEWYFAPTQVHASQDAMCHACVNRENPVCLFVHVST